MFLSNEKKENEINMKLTQLTIKDKENNKEKNDDKRELEIYYCIDLNTDQDVENIIMCLKTSIMVFYKNYKIINFNKIDYKKDNDNDVIQSGLIIFNKMFHNLKLKTANDVWFIYISNGNIKNDYKDIFLCLVNKNPKEKTCNYVVTKNTLQILKNDYKQKKLEDLKTFKKTLFKLFDTKNELNYKNFD